MGINCQPSGTPATLEAAFTEIELMDRTACLARWREAFGRSPPNYISVRFMKRVLIWELQCRSLGGLPAKTERALKRIAAGNLSLVTAKPGSRLVREWNGRTYQVEVTRDGYEMDGKTYRSLSAVARQITGARWSGPRFFGMS